MSAPAQSENKPDWLSLEQTRVAARRERNKLESLAKAPLVGLALSGGGIRSATFCLGLLHAMGRAKLIPKIDYLSTVSGGGYIGSFLGSMYVPQKLRGEQRDEQANRRIDIVEDDPFSDEEGREALDHLRQSGRHLMTGAGDAVRLTAIGLRNWFAVHLVIGLSLFTFFFFLKPFKAWLLQSDFLIDAEARYMAGRLPPEAWPSQWLQGIELHHYFVASSLWSFTALFLLLSAIFGTAHWQTRGSRKLSNSRKWRIVSPSGGGALIAFLVGAFLVSDANGASLVTASLKGAGTLGVLLMTLSAGAVIAYLVGHLTDWIAQLKKRNQIWAQQKEDERKRWESEAASSPVRRKTYEEISDDRRPKDIPGDAPAIEEDRVRHWLSLWMGKMMSIAIAIGILALIDSIAQTIYLRSDELGLLVAQSISFAVAVPVIRSIYPTLMGRSGKFSALVARFGHLIAAIVATALALVIGIFWAVLAHDLAWRSGPIGYFDSWGDARGSACLVLIVMLAVLIAANIAIGYCWGFLNLSTYASFYSGRLRRAYLGASNRNRFSKHSTSSPNADHPDDDIAIEQYFSPRAEGPVHLGRELINR